jgi:hypothetical protein
MDDATLPDDRIRLTAWSRQTGVSLEYWDLIVTNEDAIFCFVGESYKSLLLKADMGETSRRRLDDTAVEHLKEDNERNFVVPLTNMSRIALTPATPFRNAQLEIEWNDDGATHRWRFLGASRTPDQKGSIGALMDLEALSDVTVEITPRRLWFL